MNALHITRPHVVEMPPAGAIANRALAATEMPDHTLPRMYRAYRWAEATAGMPGISDEQADLIADQEALLWGMIARAPVTSRRDAITKLELVADSFDRGPRMDDTDGGMLQQVIDWLRSGGSN